jgi:hypothetical protein
MPAAHDHLSNFSQTPSATPFITFLIVSSLSPPSPEITTGRPESPPSLTPDAMGRSPRTGASSSLAARWNLSGEPKGKRAGEEGVAGMEDMFRRRPRIWRRSIQVGRSEKAQNARGGEGEADAYGDVELLEHAYSFTSIDQSDILRGGDDDGACLRGGEARISKRRCRRRRAKTRNEPSTRTSCPSESATSPVPGGMSITRTSNSSPLDVLADEAALAVHSVSKSS